MAPPGGNPPPEAAVDSIGAYRDRNEIHIDGENVNVFLNSDENRVDQSHSQTHTPPALPGAGKNGRRGPRIAGVVLLLVLGAVAYLVLVGVFDDKVLSAALSVIPTLAAIAALIFSTGD